MKDLKRDIVKYVRDKAKSNYKKDSACEICGTTKELDFHHYCSVSEMVNGWLSKNKINITTADEIMFHRDKFIEEHYDQMYNQTVTLCHKHHLRLHTIYGRNPKLVTAPKQARWVQRQRDKNGLV